jgi:hypothetical protein
MPPRREFTATPQERESWVIPRNYQFFCDTTIDSESGLKFAVSRPGYMSSADINRASFLDLEGLIGPFRKSATRGDRPECGG